MKSQKAQHEIVGFVLIVVIVSIIGLIFLSLSLRKGEGVRQTSIEISNLLESAMYYTTDCAVSFIPQYKSGQDLVKACYRNEKCLDERMGCDALEENMRRIIDDSLNVCDDCVNKAYKLNIYYKDLEVPNDEILVLENGVFSNCSSKFGGSHSIHMSSLSAGIINIELEVCR